MRHTDTDICVIGSGVAGAIVAQECVNAGREVVVLETGSRVNGRALGLRLCEQVLRDYRIPRMKLWHRGAQYRRTDCQSIGSRDYDLRGLALVASGGSTLGWAGEAYRLKPEDFRLHSMTGQGLDWPLCYQDLETYYAMGEKTLRVAGDHRDGGHPPRSSPFPLPPQPFHARDKLFLDLASDQNWPPMHHNMSLAPDGGAFTADELYLGLQKRTNFKLLTRTVATRILCSSKERATAVECWDTSNGEQLVIGAQTVVVCAGGIETPTLLRQSADEWWPEGLGNHSGHLGRHLISHPGVALGGRPRGYRLLNGPIGATASTRYFDSEKEQIEGKYLLLWRPAPSGFLFINAILEHLPNDCNTVVPSSAKTRFGTPVPVVNFNYDERVMERERVITERLEALAKQIGLHVNHRRHYVHAHPTCTTRMSEDPRDGVIDRNLRIHMMDNVYVCGSASFTSGGAANPTMTIAALAHRLGRHLNDNHNMSPIHSTRVSVVSQ